MNLSISTIGFGRQAQMAQESPKLTASDKVKKVLENASNEQLGAVGTSAFGVGAALAATKLPYVAASSGIGASGVAATMFTDAKAVKKEIAGKDSLIQEANDKITEQEIMMEEKDARIEELEVINEIQQEQIDALQQLMKDSAIKRVFRTSLWSKAAK